MSGPHRINLSTAWQPPGVAAEQTAWVRRFGSPAGIEPGDRIWLVVEAAVGCGLGLAGEPLPPVAAGTIRRHEITAMLRERNELVLTPAVAAGSVEVGMGHGRCDLPPSIGRVALEIEAARHSREGA
jgi:hypothetical protein